jgi:predicted transcriptional regulator
MTIQVELSPEIEARIAAKARAEGMPLERAAARILEEAMASRFTARSHLTVADFHAMLASMAEGSERLPNLPTESFNRQPRAAVPYRFSRSWIIWR